MDSWSATSVVLADFWLILYWVWERVQSLINSKVMAACNNGAGGSSGKTRIEPIAGFNALRIIKKPATTAQGFCLGVSSDIRKGTRRS